MSTLHEHRRTHVLSSLRAVDETLRDGRPNFNLSRLAPTLGDIKVEFTTDEVETMRADIQEAIRFLIEDNA